MRFQRIVMVGVCLFGLAVLANLGADQPKYGAIEVIGATGAKVYIEGFLAGDVPTKVEQVVPGTYRVVVKKAGEGDFVQDVSVTAGQITKVEAKMAAGGWSSPIRKEGDWTPITDADKSRYENARSKVKDRKSTRLNSSHIQKSRMPSSA